MEKVPIRVIDDGNGADKALRENLVTKVGRMLEIQTCKRSGKLAPSELEGVEREIAATDAEIDDVVYKLYGITKEERRIIENS
jgi:hypothetical protein